MEMENPEMGEEHEDEQDEDDEEEEEEEVMYNVGYGASTEKATIPEQLSRVDFKQFSSPSMPRIALSQEVIRIHDEK